MMIVLPLRGAKPYLFWGDEELINGQGSGRDGKGWSIRVARIVERTEVVDITLGNTRIPKLYKVKISQRHGLKICEIPLDLQTFLEVQIVCNLSYMDGSVEVSIQMFNRVMSGRDLSETGMIEGMKVRHVVLKFKVNGGTDK